MALPSRVLLQLICLAGLIVPLLLPHQQASRLHSRNTQSKDSIQLILRRQDPRCSTRGLHLRSEVSRGKKAGEREEKETCGGGCTCRMRDLDKTRHRTGGQQHPRLSCWWTLSRNMRDVHTGLFMRVLKSFQNPAAPTTRPKHHGAPLSTSSPPSPDLSFRSSWHILILFPASRNSTTKRAYAADLALPNLKYEAQMTFPFHWTKILTDRHLSDRQHPT